MNVHSFFMMLTILMSSKKSFYVELNLIVEYISLGFWMLY